MDLSRPYSAVAPTVEGDVLVVLAGVQQELSGREVAGLARRGTQPAVAAALDRLVEHGLVMRQQVGRSYLHSLNRDHVAAPAVEMLADIRSEFLRRLRTAISAWSVQPFHASLFGSAARADGTTKSDVDLLLVRPGRVAVDERGWRRQADRLEADVRLWSGNELRVIELARSEARAFARTPLAKEVREDGIHLAGARISQLAR